MERRTRGDTRAFVQDRPDPVTLAREARGAIGRAADVTIVILASGALAVLARGPEPVGAGQLAHAAREGGALGAALTLRVGRPRAGRARAVTLEARARVRAQVAAGGVTARLAGWNVGGER